MQQDQFRKNAEHRQQEQERIAHAAQKAGVDPVDADVAAAQSPMKRASQMQLLGIDPKAELNTADLKRAYRMKAMTMHPDRGGDPEAFQALAVAYRELTFACEVASV